MEVRNIVGQRSNILITAPFSEAQAARLRQRFDVTVVPPTLAGVSLAELGLGADLAAAQVIVAELDQVDRASLAQAPGLELVVSCRANPVNVDIEACAERGVQVATTPGRNAEVTADFSFALLMATVRHVSAAERWARSGQWTDAAVFEPYARFAGIGLHGRVLGILGGGAVGSRMVRRALGFGMTVKVYDPFLAAGHFGGDADVVALDELLATADIVTVHVPLTPSTEGLLGRRELALLRPDAYLINAGRAAIIDEDALMEVLREHRIAGAGFDVFYSEPLAHGHELFTLDNVTLTPHIAGASPDVVTEHSRIAADAILAWADGTEIRGVVNPAL
jgi:D-3-phosphoglycerate dehydrogenase